MNANLQLESQTVGEHRRAVSHLINRKAVRELSLRMSQELRQGRFTRVSESFLDEIENIVRESLASRIHRAPGIGKTLVLLVVGCGLLVGCVTGQRIVTGGSGRPALLAEAVRIEASAPAAAVEVGIVSVTSVGQNQTAMDAAMKEIRRQAGQMGANLVVVTGTGTDQSHYRSSVGFMAGNILLQPSGSGRKTVVQGKAYYVGN